MFLATLISQLSNGADTVVVFGVLFTDSNAPADILIILTLVAMAVIFVLVGIYAVWVAMQFRLMAWGRIPARIWI